MLINAAEFVTQLPEGLSVENTGLYISPSVDTSGLVGLKIDEHDYPLIVMNTVTFNALQELLDEQGLRAAFKAKYAADRNGILPIHWDCIRQRQINLKEDKPNDSN